MLRGLGEQPGYYCYDANRPDWLPYWLDDSVESACKWNFANATTNIKNCLLTNSPDCQSVDPNTADPTIPGGGTVPAGTPSNTPKTSDYSTIYLIAGAVAAVYLFGQFIGGSR